MRKTQLMEKKDDTRRKGREGVERGRVQREREREREGEREGGRERSAFGRGARGGKEGGREGGGGREGKGRRGRGMLTERGLEDRMRTEMKGGKEGAGKGTAGARVGEQRGWPASPGLGIGRFPMRNGTQLINLPVTLGRAMA